MPEGFEDEAAEGEPEEGEEEGEGKKKNEIIYLAGRIFREEPPAKPARAAPPAKTNIKTLGTLCPRASTISGWVSDA